MRSFGQVPMCRVRHDMSMEQSCLFPGHDKLFFFYFCVGLAQAGISKVLLVTSSYHMPRATAIASVMLGAT